MNIASVTQIFYVCLIYIMTTQYIKNPETGRDIKVGGPTYEKLKAKYPLEQAQRISKPTPGRKQPSRPVSPQRSNQMKEMSVYKPDLQKKRLFFQKASKGALPPHLVKRAQTYKDTGRGSRTRGWAIDAPKRGTERHTLKEKCGNKCFLLPETEAFPICPKCEGDQCTCQIDCRGLMAAKARAHQWKYTDLYETIDQLYDQKCGGHPHNPHIS